MRAVVRGHVPDRAPLYNLLRNDAVISHFTGETLTVENGPELVFKAYEPAGELSCTAGSGAQSPILGTRDMFVERSREW